MDADKALSVCFAELMTEWTDIDVAEFALGRSLGFFPAAGGIEDFTKYKHVFFAKNPLGDTLQDMIIGMVDVGALERTDIGGMYKIRWYGGTQPEPEHVIDSEFRRPLSVRRRVRGAQDLAASPRVDVAVSVRFPERFRITDVNGPVRGDLIRSVPVRCHDTFSHLEVAMVRECAGDMGMEIVRGIVSPPTSD